MKLKNKLLHRLPKILLRVLAGMGIGVGLYFLVVLIGAWIPVGKKSQAVEQPIEAFVVTNGLHASFILPVQAAGIDWRDSFAVADFLGADTTVQYALIGWGERNFYLHTPTWKDLKFSTLVSALFWPTRTAMHVTYLRRAPNLDDACKRLLLSTAQYRQLSCYISRSFQRKESNALQLIAGKGYSKVDNFYEANGKYHLFFTCNNWVNRGLKQIGIRTALWSPLDWGVMRWL